VEASASTPLTSARRLTA